MSAIDPYIYKYPLDLTGHASTNRIIREPVEVVVIEGGPLLGIPDYAPFLVHEVVLEQVHRTEGTRVTLVAPTDYIPIYLQEELSIRSPYQVCSAIYITKPIDPALYAIEMTYNTVGYPYTGMVAPIHEILAILAQEARPVTFGMIINPPSRYRPEHHFQPVGSLVGAQHLVNELHRIAQALMGHYAFNAPGVTPFTEEDRAKLDQILGQHAYLAAMVDNSQFKVDGLMALLQEEFDNATFGQFMSGKPAMQGDFVLELTGAATVEYYFTGVDSAHTVVIDDTTLPFSKTQAIAYNEVIYLPVVAIAPGIHSFSVYATNGTQRTIKQFYTIEIREGL